MTIDAYIYSIDTAILQYKLALQVDGAVNSTFVPGGIGLPQRLGHFTFGEFSLEKNELVLSPLDAARASEGLAKSAACALAVVVDAAFENLVPDRFNSTESNILVAVRIARVLRNAFTHNPFFPKWNCTNPNHRGEFEIPGVISINTESLNGEKIIWQHYGGPIALLRFAEHCRRILESNIEI